MFLNWRGILQITRKSESMVEGVCPSPTMCIKYKCNRLRYRIHSILKSNNLFPNEPNRPLLNFHEASQREARLPPAFPRRCCPPAGQGGRQSMVSERKYEKPTQEQTGRQCYVVIEKLELSTKWREENIKSCRHRVSQTELNRRTLGRCWPCPTGIPDRTSPQGF